MTMTKTGNYWLVGAASVFVFAFEIWNTTGWWQGFNVGMIWSIVSFGGAVFGFRWYLKRKAQQMLDDYLKE